MIGGACIRPKVKREVPSEFRFGEWMVGETESTRRNLRDSVDYGKCSKWSNE